MRGLRKFRKQVREKTDFKVGDENYFTMNRLVEMVTPYTIGSLNYGDQAMLAAQRISCVNEMVLVEYSILQQTQSEIFLIQISIRNITKVLIKRFNADFDVKDADVYPKRILIGKYRYCLLNVWIIRS